MTLTFVIILVTIGAAVTILSLALTRRFRHVEAVTLSSAARPGFGFTATLYALILGFILVLNFEGYSNATAAVDAEAHAIQNLERVTIVLDPAVRDDIAHQLICYARFVEGYEWTAMRNGDKRLLVDSAADRLAETIIRAEPDDPSQERALAHSLQEVEELLESRSTRLLAATNAMPPLMWGLLAFGGLVVIVWSAILGSHLPPRLRMALIVTVTSLVLASLLVVRLFELPFAQGYPGSGPSPVGVALVRIEASASDPSADRPCP